MSRDDDEVPTMWWRDAEWRLDNMEALARKALASPGFRVVWHRAPPPTSPLVIASQMPPSIQAAQRPGVIFGPDGKPLR